MKIARNQFMKDLSTVFESMGLGNSPQNLFEYKNVNDKTYLLTSDENTLTILPLVYNFPDVKVRGGELFQTIRKLKVEELDVELTEKGFSIKTENTQTIIKVNESFRTPSDFLIHIPNVWKPLNDDFCERIKLASGSCASESDKAAKPKHKFVYTCDDIIFAVNGGAFLYQKGDFNYDKMFIKGSDVDFIVKFKPVWYAKITSWLLFKNPDGVIIAAKTLNDAERMVGCVTRKDYTDAEFAKMEKKNQIIDRWLNIVGTTVTFTDIPKIINAVQDCMIFTKEKSGKDNPEAVKVEVTEEQIIISGSGLYGMHKERVKTKSTTSIGFTINPELFIHALQQGNEFIINEKMLCIKTDKFTHVSALSNPVKK